MGAVFCRSPCSLHQEVEALKARVDDEDFKNRILSRDKESLSREVLELKQKVWRLEADYHLLSTEKNEVQNEAATLVRRQTTLTQQLDLVQQQLDHVLFKDEADKYTEVDSLRFYDAVLTIRRFEDAYDGSGGWAVRCRETFNFNSDLKGVRVIPLGHFNNGKTWLISRLCGSELPTGKNVHTDGISIKVAAASHFSVVLLDTIGANSPISGPTTSSGSTDVASMLAELRMQEDFYRQLSFQVAQVILLVVGQLSHKDQTDLVQLAETIRREKQRKNIVVVHNLREWSRAQLEAQAADGMNYFQRNMAIFKLQDVSLVVTVNGKEQRVIRHRGLLSDDEGGGNKAVQVTHYYLTNDRLPCNQNESAIYDIRTIITSEPSKTAQLGQEIAEAATKIQSRFLRFAGPEPKLHFVASQSCFRADRDLLGQPPVVKPVVWGSYFAVAADEVLYNVTALPVILRMESDEKGEQREAHLLQIELPGLTSSGLAAIKRSLEKRQTLCLDYREPGGLPCVTVAFEALLLNVPEKLYESVASEVERRYKSRRAVTFVSDPAGQEVFEQGTRPNLAGGQRLTKVTVLTNVSDFDSDWNPIVTYLDGILSITLIKSCFAEPCISPRA